MDLLAKITIYISLFLGIAFFTLFSLIAIPHIIDQYENIWDDYQRSLEPTEGLDKGYDADSEWRSSNDNGTIIILD